jgi:hypothetical protein
VFVCVCVLWKNGANVLYVGECIPWKEERSEVLKKEGVCEYLMIYICVYVKTCGCVFTSWGKWVRCEWRSGWRRRQWVGVMGEHVWMVFKENEMYVYVWAIFICICVYELFWLIYIYRKRGIKKRES